MRPNIAAAGTGGWPVDGWSGRAGGRAEAAGAGAGTIEWLLSMSNSQSGGTRGRIAEAGRGRRHW